MVMYKMLGKGLWHNTHGNQAANTASCCVLIANSQFGYGMKKVFFKNKSQFIEILEIYSHKLKKCGLQI